MFAVAPLSLLALAASMSADAHPRAAGGLVTEVRDVPEFRAVASAVPFPVEITVGSPRRVEISCDSDLMGLLVTEVRGGALRVGVERDRQIEPDPACVARVSLPDLDAVSLAGSGRVDVIGETDVSDVSLAGSGDLTIPRLASRRLAVSLAGSGDVVATGSASEVDVSIAGSGDVRLREVAVDAAEVSIAGSGGVEVTVRSEIAASIVGSGDVDVWGSPSVRQSVLGSGRVHLRDAGAL